MTKLNVKLIAHTALSDDFLEYLVGTEAEETYWQPDTPDQKVNHRAAVALTAIRTCYSPGKPSEIVANEGEKYFGKSATDGEGGTDADRLFRHIFRSKHTSTLEHITYTFAVEGLSRAALAQLTRHRVGFSFSVQSQRYVRLGSDDKAGGFGYVIPPSLGGKERKLQPFGSEKAADLYEEIMKKSQMYYDMLREAGVPPEDARMVLPNAAACNLVMTANLRAILDFYAKRQPGRGAQWEVASLSEAIRSEITNTDPWTKRFFEEV